MSIDKDWIQERIDELYLLEQRAAERLGRLDVHYEKRLRSIKSQDESIKAMVRDQKSSLALLDKRLDDVHGWYRHVVKLGGFIIGLVMISLVCIFLWWWHVDTMMKEDNSLKLTLFNQVSQLPYMVHQDGKTYIRIVSNASVPNLTNKQGKRLDGDYAEVYHPTKRIINDETNY